MNKPWFNAPAPLLPEILALNARWMGDKPAIICNEQVVSWAQFHQQSCRVANGLIALGLQPGQRVAVLMNNSAEMVSVLFGTLAAGGVAVPINTLVSDQALAPMMEDAQARVVFACAANAPRLEAARERPGAVLEGGWIVVGASTNATSASGGKNSSMGLPEPAHHTESESPVRPSPDGSNTHKTDSLENGRPGSLASPGGWADFITWVDSQSDKDPALPLDDEDECNIIYSSGTTGKPKGIVHTHRRRLDWFYDLAIALRYDRASINLCAIGLFSNISWAGMGCTLLTGGTLVVMRSFDAGQWLALVEQHGVTHSAMVPVMFQRIVDHKAFDPGRTGSIKSLMCCGSPLSAELKQTVMSGLAPNLVELYGLTEGIITTLDPEDAVARPSSVGKPLMGTDLKILDKNNQACAPGEAGEIVGRGRILMAGYHDRQDANKEATWQDKHGQRWLRTGDIGYLDEAGFLFLVDRKKDMIISGGQNVYPADIEAAAEQHPQVMEVAVIGIDHPQWGESPLAVVVSADKERFDPDHLCQFVNERVGKHQRLVGAVTIDALPRNANGKILKRELREQFKNWLSPLGSEGSPEPKPAGSE